MTRPLARALLLVACLACRPPEPSARELVGSVERLDPSLDSLVAPDARLEVLATGFQWSEGPVWRGQNDDLLFSDVPANTIYRWTDSTGLTVFLRPAGFTTPNPPGRELGSNGLTLDARGALVMADHGNRQVARLDETNFTKLTIAARYAGRRLNSPNDVAYRSNGDLYFTDPSYGLRGLDADSAKEQPHNGVYRVTPSGEVTLLTSELSFPNGIAFSPDERTLYVANSDPKRPVWMAFDVQPDGSVANGRVLFDAITLVNAGKKGLPDGLKVDREGNLFATGPGGVLVISAAGKHLGTIDTGQPTANCAFGDADGHTLYVTANDRLLRVKLRTGPSGR